MLQSLLSKLFKKRHRLKILSYRRYGENGEKKGSCRIENKFQQAVVLPARTLQSSTACGGKVIHEIGTRSIIEVRENVCFACTEEVIPSSTR